MGGITIPETNSKNPGELMVGSYFPVFLCQFSGKVFQFSPTFYLGGGFKYFLFSPLPGEMIQFDEHIFQMGWFNHQLVYHGKIW